MIRIKKPEQAPAILKNSRLARQRGSSASSTTLQPEAYKKK